jgi:CheY-like chemotaxis protein
MAMPQYKHTGDTLCWLVVEDSPDIRVAIEICCHLSGFEAIALNDGFEAMAWLEEISIETENLPDIALLDIHLPGPWGHEISARIRSHPILGNIAIILMTAYELPGDSQERVLAASGADLLMFKPLPMMEEMVKIGRDIIDKRRQAEQGKQDKKDTQD